MDKTYECPACKLQLTGDIPSSPSYLYCPKCSITPLIDFVEITDMDKQREVFEKWAKDRGYQYDELARCSIGIVGTEYFNLNTEEAWKSWQAAQADKLEFARKVAEGVLCECNSGLDDDMQMGAEDIDLAAIIAKVEQDQ